MGVYNNLEEMEEHFRKITEARNMDLRADVEMLNPITLIKTLWGSLGEYDSAIMHAFRFIGLLFLPLPYFFILMAVCGTLKMKRKDRKRRKEIIIEMENGTYEYPVKIRSGSRQPEEKTENTEDKA